MSAGKTQVVTVKVFGGLRDAFGSSSFEQTIGSATTIADLIESLAAIHPEFGAKLRQGLADGYLNALVNGRNSQFLDRMETVLHPGDSVAFLPPVGGG